MKLLIIILFALMGALAGEVYVLIRQLRYWKGSAMANARARIRKNEAVENEVGQINRKAAATINRLNTENEELRDEVKRLRNMNRQLLRQMDRRKE